MDFSAIMNSPWFHYLALPLLIFCLRVTDVTIGTMRIIYVSRSVVYFAAVLGFFEVLIWLVSITQIMRHLDNAVTYLAYAGGFASGNIVGIWLENRLAVGLVAVRAITQADASELIEKLKTVGIGLTSTSASGVSGEVRLVFTIIKRKDLGEVTALIREYNPNAFISVEDVRSVSENQIPELARAKKLLPASGLDGARKAK